MKNAMLAKALSTAALVLVLACTTELAFAQRGGHGGGGFHGGGGAGFHGGGGGWHGGSGWHGGGWHSGGGWNGGWHGGWRYPRYGWGWGWGSGWGVGVAFGWGGYWPAYPYYVYAPYYPYYPYYPAPYYSPAAPAAYVSSSASTYPQSDANYGYAVEAEPQDSSQVRSVPASDSLTLTNASYTPATGANRAYQGYTERPGYARNQLTRQQLSHDSPRVQTVIRALNAMPPSAREEQLSRYTSLSPEEVQTVRAATGLPPL